MAASGKQLIPDVRGQRRSACLGAAGLVFLAASLLAAGCSGQPEPPDMPPFAGTDEFLSEQARIRRVAAEEAVSRDRHSLGDLPTIQRRWRQYPQQRAIVEERARLIELDRQRERERYIRERAEESRRNYQEFERTRQIREDLHRAQEGAQHRQRRSGDADFLREVRKLEPVPKEQARKEEARWTVNPPRTRRF